MKVSSVVASVAVPSGGVRPRTAARTRFRIAFFALLVMQGFHAFEHGLQLYQRFALHEATPQGLLGAWVGFEWVHLGFNLAVGGTLAWLYVAFRLARSPSRRAGWWAFALALVIEDGLHVPEHVVRILQFVRFGWNPAPGILGHVGSIGAGPFDLVLLHSTYNLAVTALLVVAFASRGFPDLPPPDDRGPKRGRGSRFVPIGLAAGLAALLVAAGCEGNPAGPIPTSPAVQDLAGVAPCLPQSSTLAIAAKGIRFSTGLVGCLAHVEHEPSTIVFANQDRGVEHNVGIFAGPRMYSINSPTLFRGEAFPGVRTVEYQVPGLLPGLWTFHCDLHPDQMFGTFVVPLQVMDEGFSPVHARMSQGNSMVWQSSSQSGATHSVTDASGVFGGPGGLMDSGPQRPGRTYTFRFLSAGTYAVVDSPTGHRAWISVPIRVRPIPGAEAMQDVVWSLMDAPAGFVFDVQISRPGDGGFGAFRTGVAAASAGFMADAGPGSYRFRARLRNTVTRKTSAWSPPAELIAR